MTAPSPPTAADPQGTAGSAAPTVARFRAELLRWSGLDVRPGLAALARDVIHEPAGPYPAEASWRQGRTRHWSRRARWSAWSVVRGAGAGAAGRGRDVHYVDQRLSQLLASPAPGREQRVERLLTAAPTSARHWVRAAEALWPAAPPGLVSRYSAAALAADDASASTAAAVLRLMRDSADRWTPPLVVGLGLRVGDDDAWLGALQLMVVGQEIPDDRLRPDQVVAGTTVLPPAGAAQAMRLALVLRARGADLVAARTAWDALAGAAAPAWSWGVLQLTFRQLEEGRRTLLGVSLPPEVVALVEHRATWLAQRGFSRAARLVGEVAVSAGSQAPEVVALVGSGQSVYTLATRGLDLPAHRPLPTGARTGVVSYALHSSQPLHSSGYATRAHELSRAVIAEGWDLRPVTRLGYPLESMLSGSDLGGATSTPALQDVQGVPYHRLEPGARLPRYLPEHVEAYATALQTHAEEQGTVLLQSASNYLNGLAAATAARRLGIPCVYEVRGLWEVTRASREPEWEAGLDFAMASRLEAQAAQAADAVLTLTSGLREELVRRGVDRSKIVLVPNGVDPSRFRPTPRDQELEQRLGLTGKTVIGYVGSVVAYEGLDLLLRAAEQLRRTTQDFHVLLVGDGKESSRLEALRDELGLADLVTFTGRVPFEDVGRYYSLIDVAPFPRLPLPVCEMVSPLKPFEALAMEKAVVVSDVAALTDIVTDDRTGLVFRKGDAGHLAWVLRRLVSDQQLRSRLALDGAAWVREERTWQRTAQVVSGVYESLGVRRS